MHILIYCKMWTTGPLTHTYFRKWRVPLNFKFKPINWIVGVHAMLELKPNELLIGSGDGSVALVLDKSGQGSGQSRKKSDGITRQLNEPTLSCLQEVVFKNWPSPASFSFIFVFSNKHYNFKTNINKCEKCPSIIRCWDSNPQPLEQWVSSHNH